MMPFQNNNPNYYAWSQQYFPQQNPYMQRIENLQQFQQTLQPQAQMQNQFATFGKIVESMDIVKVTDIPMDGNMYYFPKADGTEIYAKQFMSNGQTHILTFKPLLEDDTNNSSSEDIKTQFGAFGEVLEGIQNDLKVLTDKVDKISAPAKKKGGADNE